jgi:hypothetical protein
MTSRTQRLNQSCDWDTRILEWELGEHGRVNCLGEYGDDSAFAGTLDVYLSTFTTPSSHLWSSACGMFALYLPLDISWKTGNLSIGPICPFPDPGCRRAATSRPAAQFCRWVSRRLEKQLRRATLRV